MADKKQITPRRPIPSSGYDLLRKNLESGFFEGFPTENFPNPDNRANINRGRITSRKDDNVKDISIGLQDHDEAIMYYFNEVIKPSVIINGDRTPVPVIYGAPERWKGVQKDGVFRDKEGKLQVPLIMFKRDRIEKRRDLGNKLDGNNPQLYYTFQEKFTKRNQYDNFSVLQNRKPQKEFHTIVIPDFIRITYSCIIWCDYVAQMNKLVEMINYTSDSYWGDPERFKFNAKIDSYDNRTEVSQGDNRVVKTNFGLTIQGYLVPDSINKELTKKPQKFFSKSTIIFKNELSVIPTGESLTREEIRAQDVVNPNQPLPEGTGFDVIGETVLDGDVIGGGTSEEVAAGTAGDGGTIGDLTVGADLTSTFLFSPGALNYYVSPGGEITFNDGVTSNTFKVIDNQIYNDVFISFISGENVAAQEGFTRVGNSLGYIKDDSDGKFILGTQAPWKTLALILGGVFQGDSAQFSNIILVGSPPLNNILATEYLNTVTNTFTLTLSLTNPTGIDTSVLEGESVITMNSIFESYLTGTIPTSFTFN